MVKKALALLVGIAVVGVALGIVGLLRPGIADAQTPSAIRTIEPATVAPGGEVVVTITTMEFTRGGVQETLPDGFEYEQNSVMPTDIDVRKLPSGATVFTMTGVTEFSYTAKVSETEPEGGYGDAFSGVLVYLDSSDNPQRVAIDDTPVTVEEDDTTDPETPETPEPSATRSISPTTVVPGGEVVVRITTSGFTAGGIEEMLPAGFTYKAGSVDPSDIDVEELASGAVRFTMSGVSQFSYTAMVSNTAMAGNFSFSGVLIYLDDNDDPHTVMITDTPVMVEAVAPETMAPSATRTIGSAMVAPGGEVVVTITTSGFMDGGIEETLPDGFSYKPSSVSPSDIDVTMAASGAVRFTMTGVSRFRYTAMVSNTAMAGDYSFSGVLTYLDDDNELQTVTMTDTPIMVEGPGATRTIEPATVVPGGEVAVMITTRGFMAGGVEETLPAGFEYKPDSVDPSDIDVTMAEGGPVRFVMTGVTAFSYMVIAPMAEGSSSFSGELTYLDGNDNLQMVTVMGDTRVTVMTPATHTPEPTRRKPSRRGGGGGGGGGYAPVVVTATPMPTRAPSIVATIAPTPTPIIVPTIAAPTPEATPAPTPEPTAVPPTAVPTPRPTARVVVPTVAPTKPPEPTAMPKPTAVPPTAAPPTEVPPTAMVEPTEPPAPTATIAPTVAPVTPVTPTDDGMPTWLIILIIVIIVAVVIAAVGFYMMRMRR